jgi:hypothetical protein
MRGERILALAATEEDDASDMAQTTVAFMGTVPLSENGNRGWRPVN